MRNKKHQKVTVVYLCGPMRGIPYFNFPAFHAAAARLRAKGYIVLSPAEKDIQDYGPEIEQNPTGDIELSKKTWGFDVRKAFIKDTKMLMKADVLFALKGYKNSKGALAEIALAEAVGIPWTDLEESL